MKLNTVVREIHSLTSENVTFGSLFEFALPHVIDSKSWSLLKARCWACSDNLIPSRFILQIYTFYWFVVAFLFRFTYVRSCLLSLFNSFIQHTVLHFHLLLITATCLFVNHSSVVIWPSGSLNWLSLVTRLVPGPTVIREVTSSNWWRKSQRPTAKHRIEFKNLVEEEKKGM